MELPRSVKFSYSLKHQSHNQAADWKLSLSLGSDWQIERCPGQNCERECYNKVKE